MERIPGGLPKAVISQRWSSSPGDEANRRTAPIHHGRPRVRNDNTQSRKHRSCQLRYSRARPAAHAFMLAFFPVDLVSQRQHPVGCFKTPQQLCLGTFWITAWRVSPTYEELLGCVLNLPNGSSAPMGGILSDTVASVQMQTLPQTGASLNTAGLADVEDRSLEIPPFLQPRQWVCRISILVPETGAGGAEQYLWAAGAQHRVYPSGGQLSPILV